MEPERQVCSYEQAKEIKRLLGFNLNTYFSYVSLESDYNLCGPGLWVTESLTYCEAHVISHYAAPTSSELLYIIYKYSNWEYVDVRERMAEYLATILIDEINDNQIDPKSITLD